MYSTVNWLNNFFAFIKNSAKNVTILIWLMFLAWLIMSAWPASYWYNAGEIQINDSIYLEDPSLLYNGSVSRNFKGKYSVVLRTDNNEIISEYESGVFTYRTDNKRPDTILLFDYWAPGLVDQLENEVLPVGSYYAQTCWTVVSPFYGLVNDKVICKNSNIATVYSSDDLSKEYELLRIKLRNLEKELNLLKEEIK